MKSKSREIPLGNKHSENAYQLYNRNQNAQNEQNDDRILQTSKQDHHRINHHHKRKQHNHHNKQETNNISSTGRHYFVNKQLSDNVHKHSPASSIFAQRFESTASSTHASNKLPTLFTNITNNVRSISTKTDVSQTSLNSMKEHGKNFNNLPSLSLYASDFPESRIDMEIDLLEQDNTVIEPRRYPRERKSSEIQVNEISVSKAENDQADILRSKKGYSGQKSHSKRWLKTEMNNGEKIKHSSGEEASSKNFNRNHNSNHSVTKRKHHKKHHHKNHHNKKHRPSSTNKKNVNVIIPELKHYASTTMDHDMSRVHVDKMVNKHTYLQANPVPGRNRRNLSNNKHMPVFQLTRYSATVDEDVPLGTSVLSVSFIQLFSANWLNNFVRGRYVLTPLWFLRISLGYLRLITNMFR